MSAACCIKCDHAKSCTAQYDESINDCEKYAKWLTGAADVMTFKQAKEYMRTKYPGRYFTLYYEFSDNGAGTEEHKCGVFVSLKAGPEGHHRTEWAPTWEEVFAALARWVDNKVLYRASDVGPE